MDYSGLYKYLDIYCEEYLKTILNQQFSVLQWLLVLTGAFLSGSVLINILMPSLKLSKYSFFLIIGIASAHFLLAAGFMLYFFHDPNTAAVVKEIVVNHPVANVTG